MTRLDLEGTDSKSGTDSSLWAAQTLTLGCVEDIGRALASGCMYVYATETGHRQNGDLIMGLIAEMYVVICVLVGHSNVYCYCEPDCRYTLNNWKFFAPQKNLVCRTEKNYVKEYLLCHLVKMLRHYLY